MDFNSTGQKLAVGGSYNFDNDEIEPNPIPEPMISIISVKESNVRPKK